MNPLLRTIIIILISSLVFTVLLNMLNRYKPKVFSFINKIPEGWKGKIFIKWIFLFLLMVIVSVIVVIGGLNDRLGTIIIGFCISFTDFIFDKPKGMK